MKKFYASMLALACVVTAGAAVKNFQIIESNDFNFSKINKLEMAPAKTLNVAANKIATSRVDEAQEWDLVGTCDFQDLIFSGEMFECEVYESKTQPGFYEIPEAWSHSGADEYQPFYIDATNPAFVQIPAQAAVYSEKNGAYYCLSAYTTILLNAGIEEAEILEDEENADVIITYEADYKYIDIPYSAIYCWVGDAEDADPDYMIGNEGNMEIDMPGFELWANTGSAIIEGDLLGLTGEEIPAYEARVQASGTPGLIRIINPYLGGAYGPMYIDLTNLDYVSVPYQAANLVVTLTEAGDYSRMAILSYSAYFDSLDEYIEEGAPDNLTGTVEGENIVIDIPMLLCHFPDYDTTGLYYAGKNCKITVPVSATGVNTIKADNLNNGKVEYYNLQGVRVANPTNGLYIRRQGNEATKVLVK